MSKIVVSPVDLLIERFMLFFRLLGVSGGGALPMEPLPVKRVPRKYTRRATMKTRMLQGVVSRDALAEKIRRFLLRAGQAVRKTDILHHIAKLATLDDVNGALRRLVECGLVRSFVVAGKPGRPAEMWGLVDAKSAHLVAVKAKHSKIAKSVKVAMAVAKSSKPTQAVQVARFLKATKRFSKAAKRLAAVKVFTAKSSTAMEPTVTEMSIAQLGFKIWSFMRGQRPVNRQVISGHLGHKVPAVKINAALAHLKRQGKARDLCEESGRGRPAVLWTARK